MERDMKTLVTGGSGRIGRDVVVDLVGAGDKARTEDPS